MKTIIIDDYIGNNAEALKEIRNFSRNKLIIKGSCGIGGTNAVLAIEDLTIIIVSPYTGMIQSKEQQNTHPHKLFIYENSHNKWHEVENLLDNNQHFILNTTPDQILKIKKTKPFLFQQIKKIALFIDECHIAAEADYRKALSEFNHIVFNEWENFFTLSTATPVYHNIDIPKAIQQDMEIILIKRRNESLKNITLFHYRQHQEWVLNELRMGRKVVVFTNEASIYNNFLQFDNIRTQPLVGKHLEVKVATFKDAGLLNLSNVLDLNNDLFIMSTKFITGFDFPADASVAIISNENSQTDTRYIPDIVQAYGRIRGKVLNAGVFYNRHDNAPAISHEEFMQNFEQSLEHPAEDMIIDGQLNHTLVVIQHLPHILRQQTYSSVEELAEHLMDYGFNPTIDYRDDGVIIPSGLTISDKVENLLSMPLPKLKEYTTYVFNNIQGDDEDYNGFGERLQALYAAACIAKLSANSWLQQRLRNIKRYGDLVDVLKTFVDANTRGIMLLDERGRELPLEAQISNQQNYKDSPVYYELVDLTQFTVSNYKQGAAIRAGAHCANFLTNLRYDGTFQNAVFMINTMHVINMVQDDRLDDGTLQTMEMHSLLAEFLKEDYIAAVADLSEENEIEVTHRINRGDESLDIFMRNRYMGYCFRHTLSRVVRNLSFEPTAEQQEHLRMRMQKHINILSKSEAIRTKLQYINYSREHQKQLHRHYLMGLASLHIAGHMCGFRRSVSDHREYNIATKVPKQLRNHYTPYHMIEIDIQSSNAQIIDRLFNTTVGLEVYGNLQRSYGVTRKEAKVLYNSTLNNNRLSAHKAAEVYARAGYDLGTAQKIAEFTTSEKIFATLFAEEEDMIWAYRCVSRVQNALRCHDALIMIATVHNISHLPTEVEGVSYKITYY